MDGRFRAALERRHGAGLDDAGIVDLRRQHGVGRLRRHDHFAAVGDNGPLVLDQRVQRALVDGHVDKRIPSHVEGDLFARRHRHRAERGGDHALVRDGLAEQRDISALSRVDPALIDDRGVRRAEEAVFSGHEVGVGDIERRGDQAADIDLRASGEEDARRIHDEHLSIGIEGARDHARLVAGDAVERDGRAARLIEVHSLLRGDGEALPVDDRLVGRLVDVGDGPRLRDTGRAADDRAPGGARGGGALQHHQGRDGRHGEERPGDRTPPIGKARQRNTIRGRPGCGTCCGFSRKHW